ncbi:unnamed protein product [Sphagnum jensenii]|jgi:hypothetical protein|uniref:LYR motif containing domain-containing protein n=1 Tax=Sphagnum jensenii TaxID=128206 RepID=A0ABP0W7U1_9BRYO
MARGFVWATAEDLLQNRAFVLSLYRSYLRVLASDKLSLSLAAQASKRAQVREMFDMGAQERSLHNIQDLIDAAKYTLSQLHKGQIPRESYNK